MVDRSQFRVQVNDLIKQAVDQLEEVRGVLARSRNRIEGRIEEDMLRLRGERDRLLKVLGEQTYKLANQGKVPLPTVVKRTVERLNDVLESLVVTQKRTRAAAGGGGAATTTAASTSASSAKKKAPRKKAAKKKAAKKA